MKFNLLKRAGAFVAAALLLTLCAVAASAQEEGVPRVVDEVIAQVNDQVITLSMLKREMKEAADALRQQNPSLTAEQAEAEVAKRQNEITVSLINEQLMLQKGKELGLAEDVEAQVNQRLLEIAKQQGIKTIEQLEEAMRQEHLEPSVIRQTMRTEAMKNAVLSSEVDRKVYFSITDAEVRSYYDAHKDKFRKPEAVTLSEIFLNSAGKPDAEVLAHAQKLVAQLRAGADFKTVAAAESEREDERGKRVAPQTGGKVGTYPVPDISNKTIADAIRSVKAGGVTEPIKTDDGYLILRVDERTPAGDATFDENKVRETIAYERLPKERDDYLTKLRQEAYIQVADGYRDALLPLLKLETQKTASANPADPAKKDDKKKKP